MNTVYFCNEGEFDVRAMLTFGVSVKDDDAIGYFGTGFKYAVAIILRNGGEISVKSGSDSYVFTKSTENIRGKSVDLVLCNGENAGFTTHLGINWKPWMAYRELYSNCLDEGGLVSAEYSLAETVIEVNCHEIYQAFKNTDEYFLNDKPIYTGKRADIHRKRSNFVYFKGVAIGEIDTKYSYNLHSAQLTEDRTAKSEWEVSYAIKTTIQHLTDSSLLRDILAPGDCFESKISFDFDFGLSDEFIETASSMMKTNIGVSEGVRSVMADAILAKGEWPDFQLTDLQEKMLIKAISFLDGIGVNVSEFPIKNVTGLGSGVMGRAHNGIIYLSDMPYQMGTKQLASTLLEEWVHNKFGCHDFDRQMQSWLFDKVLSIGEELNGEPL